MLGRLLFCGIAGLLFLLPSSAQMATEGTGSIRVNVRSATGSPLSTGAIVKLRQNVGSMFTTQNTREAGTAEFPGLPVGNYVIEVSAPGFQTATEEVTIYGASNVSHVYIMMRPESVPGAAVASGPPVLAPKAQKEIQDATRALEKGDLDAAEKHLQRAEKLAPTHPDVHYLQGMLLVRRNDLAAARQRFEKAISIYPEHTPSISALARLLFRTGDTPGATVQLERAVVLDGRSQENHAMLATLLFQQNKLEKARYHAEQALDIAGGKQPGIRLLLAQIVLAQGDRAKAIEHFETFLANFPEHPDALAARMALTQLRSPQTAPAAAKPPAGDSSEAAHDSPAGGAPPAFRSVIPDSVTAAPVPVAREWGPKDVDQTPPAVFRDVTCNLEQVLERTGRSVVNLANNLGDVNATETVTHTEIDPLGRPGRSASRSYEYMFSIRRGKPNLLWVEEFRDGQAGDNNVFGNVHTMGVAALALIFHPTYAGDFEMKCEGQGQWRGEPVWFVHFRQRDDKPSRIYTVRSERGATGVPLKGRAWIAANSHQIVRLETGIVAAIPELRLDREQMIIEYGPVSFKDRKQVFWLPSNADIYAHLRGQRYQRRHALSNYIHFAVNTRQKIQTPDPPQSDPPPLQ